MSLVHELAASVQCCFELFGTQSDGVLLSRHDQGILNEISSILQPVLLRLQKQAVAVAESSELFAEDEQLLQSVVSLRRSLESLQSCVGSCRVSHWLLRVLTAEDVRRGLEGGLAATRSALQQLVDAEGAADVGPLHEVEALRSSLCEHKVTRHDGLERLGTGLYRHMEQASDAEQVVSMLRFVVREAQTLMMRRKHSRGSSSSSSSRRDSDSSDTSTCRIDQDTPAAAAVAAPANSSSSTGTARTASSMDTGSSSDGSSSGGSRNKNNAASSSSSGKDAGSSSKARGSSSVKPGDMPPGETSLTDVQLLLGVQQLADVKTGTQQLVLYQILSILEELHEHKASQLKHKHKRSSSSAGGAPPQGSQLTSVPEGSGDDSIAAIRAAAAADGAGAGAAHAGAGVFCGAVGNGHYAGSNGGSNGGYYGSNAAAAAAAGMGAGAGGQPVTYGSAVAAVAGGLEQLLWADPWDAVAMTQLMELLLQAAVEDEYVEAEAHNPSSSSKSSSSKADGSKGGGRKWWGQMGAAAKAALTSAKGSGPSPSGKPPSSSRSAARAAGGEAAAAQQKQRQERVHQMVSSALDVLLRLTPPPPGTDSCLKSLARPDVAPMRSLALPLMVAGDAVPALSGCMWSSWTDVATKVARLVSILVRSESDLADSTGIAAAVGLASSPAAIHHAFSHGLCSTGGTSGSCWHGLVTLLHNSNQTAAAAAAEAIAAIGSSSRSHELCSSLAASQAARALLLLLSKHQQHLGAAGAAAAALRALSDARVRPGMHDLLVSSYTEGVSGTPVPLGDSCVAIMLSNDCLAACRAARLAAALAHGINWTTAAAHSGSNGGSSAGSSGSLWGETFRAGMHVLQRSRSSSSSSSGGEEGSPTVAGAVLLRELVLQGCLSGGGVPEVQGTDESYAPDSNETEEALGALARSREALCLEAVALTVHKLQGYDVGRAGKEGQVQALIECLGALLSHMSEGAVCGVLPELFGVVVPLLEALQRKGGSSSSSSGSLGQAAAQLQEQLMVLGG